ncbi:MAG: hypothetical protein RL556_497 [Actinomycetota bacterium]|jgi:hypothetical protein
MSKISTEARQQILITEIAKYTRKGWSIMHTEGFVSILAKRVAKHNGILGGVLLAPFSLGLSLLWTAARNLDQKVDSMLLSVDEFGQVDVQYPDTDELMATLEVMGATPDANDELQN